MATDEQLLEACKKYDLERAEVGANPHTEELARQLLRWARAPQPPREATRDGN